MTHVVTSPSGEVLAEWPLALPPALSPCRPDPAKGVRQHRCSAWHAWLVEGYRLARTAYEQAEEHVTSGYATETADHRRDNPQVPTFRGWLRGCGERAPERAA